MEGIQISSGDFFKLVEDRGFEQTLVDKGGILQVLDVFPLQEAQEALRVLRDVEQSEWLLSTNKTDNDAKHRFFRYEGRGVDVVMQPLLKLGGIMHPEIHAAKYESGGHIAVHNDARSRAVEQHELARFKNSYPVGTLIHRRIAMIYYLTEDWKEEYGGCFVDHYVRSDPRTIVPRFNSLVAFLVPRDHSVTEMRDSSPPRFTIFGWFSKEGVCPSGKAPLVQSPVIGDNVEVIVTVPENAQTGDLVQFSGPDGQLRKTQVPQGLQAGETFSVRLRPQAETWTVQIPEGRSVGDLVSFVGPQGVPLTAPIPEGLDPSQTSFNVMVPIPQPLSVRVPKGKQPGDHFTFMDADGIEQNAIVPEGALEEQFITVMVSPPTFVDVNVTIPNDLKVGDEFTFIAPKGTHHNTRVPEGKKAGELMTVRVPVA